MLEQDDTRPLLALLARHYDRSADQGRHASDFLYSFGSVQSALLHAALLAPRFVEVEGAVFLGDIGVDLGGAEALTIKMRRAKAESPVRLKEFVDSCNWLELPFLFSNKPATNDEYDALARLVAEAWHARLKGLFPGRHFVVRVIEPGETGSVIGVGFEQTWPSDT